MSEGHCESLLLGQNPQSRFFGDAEGSVFTAMQIFGIKCVCIAIYNFYNICRDDVYNWIIFLLYDLIPLKKAR
jgi:hypothetical protein